MGATENGSVINEEREVLQKRSGSAQGGSLGRSSRRELVPMASAGAKDMVVIVWDIDIYLRSDG